jgi:hypothetical protein
MQIKKFIKNKQHSSKKNSQQNMKFYKMPSCLVLNRTHLSVELTQTVYLRTGQTIASFDVASQLYYVNLNTLLANSNNLAKQETSGVPNFEFMQVTSFHLTWYPTILTSTQGTFEPTAFDLRYLPTRLSDTTLPSGYYGNYNESHFNVLLQQTSRPIGKLFCLKQMPAILSSSQGKQCLGQLVDAFNFTTNYSNMGGILTIIQSTPSLNNVSAYSPKLGFFEIKYELDLYNSIV